MHYVSKNYLDSTRSIFFMNIFSNSWITAKYTLVWGGSLCCGLMGLLPVCQFFVSQFPLFKNTIDNSISLMSLFFSFSDNPEKNSRQRHGRSKSETEAQPCETFRNTADKISKKLLYLWFLCCAVRKSFI